MNIKRIFLQSSLPSKREVKSAIQSFSKQRKIAFLFFACLFFVSGIALFAKVAIQPFQQEIPIQGGTHKEGIVGTPRFVNPVLSFSTADQDVESLVFAGLTRKTIEGSSALDLAEDFSVSSDNLVYTFTIAENARFHDGQPVTAQDVVFTIQSIQNPELKSPKQIEWEGVTVEALDERRVRFTLRQPFISFLENTSIGILPFHLWKDVEIDEFAFSPLNTNPVGAGKYAIINTMESVDGTVDAYILRASKNYGGGKPFIKRIHLYFFPEEKDALRAFKTNKIDAFVIKDISTIEELPKNTELYTTTLHRMFGLFFNQKENSPIREKKVRQAIDLTLDRQKIIDIALQGFGRPIKSPLPTTITTSNNQEQLFQVDRQKARELLSEAGWIEGQNGIRQKNGRVLEITLTTAKIEELEQVAQEIQSQLASIGIRVVTQTLETNDLNQNVIRPRNFEMLLFGLILNQEADIFPFWHSSQTSDPGLNISSYKNQTVDTALAQIIQTFDTTRRANLYRQFEQEFFNDIPALFIYNPELIYAVRGTLKNIELSPITNSSERLVDMERWYKETNYIFSFSR